MRIAGDWLAAPGAQAVCTMLEAAGHRALFVGGCVRNALMGRPVADLDIATDALPEAVMALAAAAGLRTVPTGLAHGTVTVIAAGVPHEVTTFRRDVATDGRHATVAFTAAVEHDAARRDFTMNALYADRTGQVIDPLGGLPDLRAGRVRFVGDPAARIAEDYLRVLRFFRFHAHYGADGLDPEGLAACAAAVPGLGRLSRERVGAEMRKLLAAPDPAPAVAAMAAAGVLGAVLPGADPAPLAVLVHLEGDLAPEWLRRLAALGGAAPAEALRLSRAEAQALDRIAGAARDGMPPHEAGYRLGAEAGRDAVLVRAALLAAPLAPGWAAEVARGAAAVCPVSAADFMPRLSGPALGAALKAAEDRWIASGFSLARNDLAG
ncbi:MAG: CCA tRNA nucleotidyltransferase [Gemmobacter sp.]